MTTPRDPDRLLELFLDEGPEVLPDRVLDGVQDDIHRMHQRALFGSWRFFTMRSYLAAAAVVLIVVAGGGILWANRNSFIGSSTPSPTAMPSPTATPSPAAPVGELTPGATYRFSPGEFTQPFTFTLPTGFNGTVRGDLWTGGGTFRLRDERSGAVTFHDDTVLPDNLCHPTGTIDDVPALFEDWLTADDGITVSASHQLMDAVSAVYWDIELAPSCDASDAGDVAGHPVISFSAGEHHRIYRVDLGNAGGSDQVLVVTWGAGYGGEGDQVLATLNPLIDRLVESIR
jgi:hypothetical protein